MNPLFECPPNAPKSWQEEWVGMPEFVQEEKEEYAKIIIRFESAEDLKSFQKLTGIRCTQKTKSQWYPPKSNPLLALSYDEP